MRVNSYFWRNYKGKTGRGRGFLLPSRIWLKVPFCYSWEKLSFLKFLLPRLEKFVSRSVLGEVQLTQISINIRNSCCNLNISDVIKKPNETFSIYVLFLRHSIFSKIVLRFSCKKTLFNVTDDRKGISSHCFIVIYDYYKATFITLSKNIVYWICSSPKLKLGKFWTILLGKTS